MATYDAADLNIAVDMFQLFAFEPTFGSKAIESIHTGSSSSLIVSGLPSEPGGAFEIHYFGTGLTANGTTPVSGSFNSMSVYIDGVLQGELADIPGLGNFSEIDLLQAYNVLLGDDTINGSNRGDTLFTGDGGTDSVDAKNGNDKIFVATAAGAPTHAINGGAGTDTIGARSNNFTADKVLDLRNATLQSIEALTIDGGLTVRLLGSQIGAGHLSSTAAVAKGSGVGDASLEVVLAAPGSANLSGFTVGAGVSIIVFGSAGADTVFGSKIADVISGGLGKDTIVGGLGADTMSGGSDGDIFDFNAVAEIGKKKGLLDLITDWGSGDKIDLSTIDANGSKKGDKAFKLLKKEGADFTKAGQVGFDQKKSVTYVQGDTTGDGKADFKLEVTGKIDFEKADFVL